jgi:hypothetical protein
MPTVVPESDAFVADDPAAEQRRAADAASILLYAQHFANSRRYLYNRHRTRVFDVTRAPYNADPSGAVDATSGIQNAINDAASSVGGGDVYLPGRFKYTGLAMSPSVNLRGIPGITRLSLNHATNDALTFGSGGGSQGFGLVEGISFCAAVDGTGNLINGVSGHAIQLKVLNCAYNDDTSGGKMKGRMLFTQGTGSIYTFEECFLSAKGDANADLFFLSAADGELWLNKNRAFMPLAYSSNLLQIDDGRLASCKDNVWDVTAHGGSADIMQFLSLGYHSLSKNTFLGAFSGGSCIKTVSGGIKISETGSVFDTVNPYALGGLLALGSDLTLSNPLVTALGGTTATCATGYRAQVFKATSTDPTITLPGILFIGQEFTLTVYNFSGSPWSTGIGLAGTRVAMNAGSVPTGQARTFHFKALDIKNDGTAYWVLRSDPSSPYVVP